MVVAAAAAEVAAVFEHHPRSVKNWILVVWEMLLDVECFGFVVLI